MLLPDSVTMSFDPVRFIGEQIEVEFDQPPLLAKTPPCPDRFTWHDATVEITSVINQWSDYARRGRMARNMRPTHAAVAASRGSWGVGRFYFRVRTNDGRVFDLYYDREPKNADDRQGSWILYREMAERAED
jgi:hypothetical protein